MGNICNAVILHLTEGLMFKILMTLQNLWSVLISCKDQKSDCMLKIKVLKFGYSKGYKRYSSFPSKNLKHGIGMLK